MRISKLLLSLTIVAALLTGMVGCGSSNPDSDAEATTSAAKISVNNSGTDNLKNSAMNILNESVITDKDSESLNSAMTEAPTVTDPLTLQYNLLYVDEGSLREYQVVFYGGVTGVLKAIHDELHLYKSAGYTEEIVKSLDMNDIYPGFSDLSYTKTSYTDQGNYFCFVAEFNELNDPDHLDELYDCGLKILNQKGTGMAVDAASYKDILVANGAKEVSDSEVHAAYEGN